MPTSSVKVLDDAASVSAALAPIRRRILKELVEPDSAAGLAVRLEMPRQKVNYHLRELEKSGFVELIEERPKRGCIERIFRPSAKAFVIDPALLGPIAADGATIRDRFSSAYLVAVAARMIRDVAVLRERAARARKKLLTQTLETEIRFERPEDFDAFTEELGKEMERLVQKHGASEGARGRRFRFVLGAHPARKEAT